MSRAAVAAAHRTVVKVGSSSLTSGGRLDPQRLDAIVDALARRHAAGQQVVLVSSGAIAAGLGPLGLSTRPRDLATQQAAASVGQLLLVERYVSASRVGVFDVNGAAGVDSQIVGIRGAGGGNIDTVRTGCEISSGRVQKTISFNTACRVSGVECK